MLSANSTIDALAENKIQNSCSSDDAILCQSSEALFLFPVILNISLVTMVLENELTKFHLHAGV